MDILTGIIQKDGSVIAEDGTIHYLPKRGTDKEGYPEVLIDDEEIGGYGYFHRQSVKPFVGMTVEFVRVNKEHLGYNFVILKNR